MRRSILKKQILSTAFFFFAILFLLACGSGNPADDAGTGSGAATDVRALDAGTAISEEFPPTPACEPTATTAVINGTVKEPFLDIVIFGAGVTLTREGTAPQHSSTDEQGIYRFCALAPGSYQVSSYAMGFETINGSSELTVEVRAGLFQTADLELSLGGQEIPSNIGAVRGSVVDISNVKVLSGVSVEALNNVTNNENGDLLADVVKSTVTDINGEFFLSLSIGTHSLRLSKEGYHTPPILLVTIQSDKVTKLRTDPVELFPE